MRILFLTNYYPPSEHGWGYMQLCEEVADGLAARGHQMAVLTSTHQNSQEVSRPYPVHRRLTIDPDWNSGRTAAQQFFVGRRQREREAVTVLEGLVKTFRPDVVLVWDAMGLPRALLQAAEQQTEVDTVYYLANYLPEVPDEYVAYWQKAPVHPIANMLKKPLSRLALAQLQHEGKPIGLRYENVMCVSNHVRQRLVSQALVSEKAVVVHNGVDPNQFGPHPVRNSSAGPLSCLIAGRIMPEKGIHTAVEAFAQLSSNPRVAPYLRLTILGDGPTDYVQELRRRVAVSELEDSVCFLPPITRDKMPEILRQHRALLLPSEWAEPIARSMQEAMAVGLLVIGTMTGGSGELLVDEQTGLAFEAGNAQALARQLERAASDPDLVASLAAAGQTRVRESFRIDQTVSNVEVYLESLTGRHR